MLSPDGRTVALSGSDGIALQPVGGGTRQLLKDTGRPLLLWDWPAPSMIIFGNGELFAVNPQTGSTRPLISGGKPGDYYGHGRLSPDGKWISAMQWTNADQARVMVPIPRHPRAAGGMDWRHGWQDGRRRTRVVARWQSALHLLGE